VALEHLGFLVLEMFLWTKPFGRRCHPERERGAWMEGRRLNVRLSRRLPVQAPR